LGAFPRLIKVYEKEGDQAAIVHLSEIATILLYWGIPMVVGIAALAEPLSSLLLGEEYRKTATLLMPLMALTGLLNGVRCYVFDQVFHLKKVSMMHSYILAPASVINIILNFFFIPIYGTTGAACATLFSFLFALCASIFFSRKILSVSLSVKEIRITMFSSFAMWGFLFFFIKNNGTFFLLFSIPSGCAVYFLCSKYLGSKVTESVEQQLVNRNRFFK
jgi:O-antigen/teichoic acid export membrane protein